MTRWLDALEQIDVELQRVARSDARVIQTIDPATLLLTACLERLPDSYQQPSWVPARTMELEFAGVGPNTLAELADAPVPAAALSQSASGDQSVRYVEILEPNGIADDLRVVFRDGSDAWGAAMLYRFSGHYHETEIAAVAELAPAFGRRIRLALLADSVDRASASRVGAPGIARITQGSFVDISDAGAIWLDTLTAEQRTAVVADLAASEQSSVTVVGASGPIAFHATGRGDAWVVIELARAVDRGTFVMAALGLTTREQDVMAEIAHGRSTSQIARHLGISEWTAKDHIKAIHRKAGVGSRAELLAKIFAVHFRPHLDAGTPPSPYGFFSVPTDAPNEG